MRRPSRLVGTEIFERSRHAFDAAVPPSVRRRAISEPEPCAEGLRGQCELFETGDDEIGNCREAALPTSVTSQLARVNAEDRLALGRGNHSRNFPLGKNDREGRLGRQDCTGASTSLPSSTLRQFVGRD